MKFKKEPIHSISTYENWEVIIKEYSVELVDNFDETVWCISFEEEILKEVVIKDILILSFDHEIIQYNLRTRKQEVAIETDQEIRDIMMDKNGKLYICFANCIGYISPDGVIIYSGVEKTKNYSAMTEFESGLVVVDFYSVLTFYDKKLDILKSIDYSDALDIASENPPFPVVLKPSPDSSVLFLGLLNGIVLLITRNSLDMVHEPTLLEGFSIYAMDYHSFVISDIIFHGSNMFISSNDRAISHYRLDIKKIEFIKKYNLKMRAESLIPFNDKVIAVGIDSPFIETIVL
eukprot:NODE_94_length_21525_cov_0.751003.p8 type:complete len:290 gc:universal NODE_94_length_21525_cov_0.751003:1132-2001(+)